MKLNYSITVENPANHQAHVTLRIEGIYLNEISLFIRTTDILRYRIQVSPWNCQGECNSLTYGEEHISNFTATDGAGNPLPVRSIDHYYENQLHYINEKKIQTAGISKIIVEYDVTVLAPVEMEPVPKSIAFLGEHYGLIKENYFFYRPDTNGSWPGHNTVSVQTAHFLFNLPQGWKAASVWAEVGNKFSIENPGDFCRTLGVGPWSGPFLGLGPFEIATKKFPTTEVISAVIDKPSVPAQKLSRLVFYSFQRYHDIVGNYPGNRFLVYTISDYNDLGPKYIGAPRARHSAAVNFRYGDENWTLYPDEMHLSMGRLIGFFADSSASWYDAGSNVLTWNKIPYELGYMTKADYYDESIPSVENCEQKDGHMYVGFALKLDEMVKEYTEGEKELEDVTAALYELVGRGPPYYSNEDIQVALDQVTGHSFTDFFNNYVYPNRCPPLDSLRNKYKSYPDLEIRSGDIKVKFVNEDEISVNATIHNLGNQQAEAEIKFYRGYPWTEGKLLKTVPITIEGAVEGKEKIKVLKVNFNISSFPANFVLFVDIVNVQPGDLRTRNGQRTAKNISIPETAAFRVTKEGNVYTDQGYYCGSSPHSEVDPDPYAPPCFNSGAADIAESIKVAESVTAGNVVALDPKHPGQYRKTREPYSTLASGVISTRPAFRLGISKSEWESQSVNLAALLNPILDLEGLSLTNLSKTSAYRTTSTLNLDLTLRSLTTEKYLYNAEGPVSFTLPKLEQADEDRYLKKSLTEEPLLALMGVVPVKATTENGPIEPGDLLTTSSKPGHVMVCKDKEKCAGAIIGKALEPLEKGSGVIKMLVMR